MFKAKSVIISEEDFNKMEYVPEFLEAVANLLNNLRLEDFEELQEDFDVSMNDIQTGIN